MNKQTSPQSGSSLLYVILISGMLLVIIFSVSALTLLQLSTTQINERSQQAFYAAEAGLERALFAVQQDASLKSASFSAELVSGVSEYRSYVGVTPPGDPNPDTSLSSFSLSLSPLEMKQIALYNPDDLTVNMFQGPSAVTTATVSIECVSGCVGDPANGKPDPGLEVSVLSFDPSTVGSFDVNALLQSDLPRPSLTDESKISITRTLADNVTNIADISLDTLDTRRYLLQLKALRAGATYSVTLSKPIQQTNTLPISAFGDVGGTRRAIEMVLNANLVPKSLFDYAIFSHESIEKFAK